MKLHRSLLITILATVIASPAMAAGRKGAKGTTNTAPKGARAKNITGEATIRTKDQSKIDFEAADIGGERKTPLGTLINQNKADKNYDFVKIRLRWHPEMVQSASALDSGK
ncbi:MAG: hypothetical protein FJ146_00455 [Deltaproteobacteria bacterium]|nr:hypothetical protein [Deltaproteobacteria bacterium]